MNFWEKGCFLAILAGYLLRGLFIAGQILHFRYGVLVRGILKVVQKIKNGGGKQNERNA